MEKKISLGTRTLVAALCALITPLGTGALAADEALDIMRRVDENGKSASSRIVYAMHIRPADGSPARSFALISHENSDGDSLIEFTEPRTVRGMKILSKDASSWVYFPSTGRTRKIAGSSRSGSVQGVGGDFSYDDLGGDPWEDSYTFALLSSDQTSWTIRGVKKTDDAAYDEVELTVDKKLLLPTRVEFFKDKEGGHVKTLELSGFADYSGRARASKMTMKNVKKGSSTEVRLLSAAFDQPLDAALFDPVRFSR